MTATTHRLKTWPKEFALVRQGKKPFELRWNDRDYQPEDVLELAEFDPVKGAFTGEVEVHQVTCVIDAEIFGLKPGYVALGMAPIVDVSATPTDGYRSLQLADVQAYHEAEAQRAFQRADSYRRSPSPRLHVCAQAADDDAGFHAAAALLIRTAGGVKAAAA